MQKSESYKNAMVAVIKSDDLSDDAKVEALMTLAEDRRSALWAEEREEQEAKQ